MKKLNKQQALQLLEQYYEGNTSRYDEERLVRFLFSKQKDAQSTEFDEHRAVLLYQVAGRVRYSTRKRSTKRSMIWVAAASIAILMGIGSMLITQRENTDNEMLVAYVNGERIDDSEIVLEQMQIAIHNVAMLSPSEEIEVQLTKVFND